VKLHGPPEIENGKPLIRRDYVTLRGTVSATNGFSTFVRVYWGTGDANTNKTGWEAPADFGLCGNGLLATNITDFIEEERYYFRFFATNAAGEAWAATSGSFTAPGSLTFNDVTFFSVSDSHYEATPEENSLKRAAVDRMNALPGIAYPAGLGSEPVDVPRGVLALGDLIDDGANASLNSSQLTQWTNDFGVNGEKLVMFPVYEGFGNHDLSQSHLVQNAIKARTQERIGLKLVSSNGLHYSWDWDAVHFVQLNLFPGNVHETPNYGPIHDPEYALDFLKNDLAFNVGGSGRPVIISHHYDPRDTWWTENQKSNYYNAITNYNVICIIHGHTGTGIYKWRGLDVVNDGNLGASIFVFHVTSNRLYAAQRKSDNTWGTTLSKPITIPPIPEPAGMLLLILPGMYLLRRLKRNYKI